MKYPVSSSTIFDSKFASDDALDGRAPRPAQAPALAGVAAVGGRGGVVEVTGGGWVVGAAEGLAICIRILNTYTPVFPSFES